jgi:putative tryptophan/tyrosine transport system substrate-binding protein
MASDRREFMTLAGTALASWPSLARAQASRRTLTIAVLMGLADDDEAKRRLEVFEQGLVSEGWIIGQNVHIEDRYSAGDPRLMHKFAAELVALHPDVIVAHSTPVVRAVLQVSHAFPIVFVVVADPVGSGFAASIARPGGNATGFTNLSGTITGKLLTILTQITPDLSHVALLFNPKTVARGELFNEYLNSFDTAASVLGLRAKKAEVGTSADIDETMSELGREPGSGLIVAPDNFTTVHRDLIIALAAQWRIPAIYPYKYFAEDGGLISYGVDVLDLFRRAADYVSRILHGANPGELPIQAPTKFEMVINLKTAKTLDLTVPRILLAGADDLID